MENNQAVLDVIKAGGVICYAPCSGDLVLLDNKGKISTVKLSMMDFVIMKRDEVVQHTDHMGQGHHILHGPVDFYKISR